MKKIILAITLISLLLVAFDNNDEPVDTIRLTLVNKSEKEIAVQLIDGDYTDYDNIYYLRVAEGDRQFPTEKHYDIVPGVYNMQVFYLETYDPVYGFDCLPEFPITLIARKNMRITIHECGRRPANWGEPTITKYWYWVFPPWKSRPPGLLY